MSWLLTEFSFNTSQSSLPSAIVTFDLNLNYANPGIDFNGTETNSVYCEVREVAGDLWFAQNATFDGTNWVPKNASTPAFATVMRSPASVSQPGYMQRMTCAAGVNPISWTVLWQIDNTGVVTSAGEVPRRASVAAQLIDGSTNTVTYSTAFQTATDQVFITVSNMSDAAALPGTPIILTKSTTGFTYAIPGGNTGDTATVDYLAYGH